MPSHLPYPERNGKVWIPGNNSKACIGFSLQHCFYFPWVKMKRRPLYLSRNPIKSTVQADCEGCDPWIANDGKFTPPHSIPDANEITKLWWVYETLSLSSLCMLKGFFLFLSEYVLKVFFFFLNKKKVHEEIKVRLEDMFW